MISYYSKIIAVILFVIGFSNLSFSAVGDRYWGVFGIEVNANMEVIRVYSGSPSDGRLRVGDKITDIGSLGARSFDRSFVFGQYLDDVEARANGGTVNFTLSDGRVVGVPVQSKGSWSVTAPKNCPKCDTIVQDAIDYIMGANHQGKLGLHLLALLSTGDAAALAHFKEKMDVLKPSSPSATVNWYLGVRLIALCEYYLITRDQSIADVIRRQAIDLYRYRDTGGLWGAGVRQEELQEYPNGPIRGGGYGSYNAVTIQSHLALLLAEKCGLASAEVVSHNRTLTAYLKSTVGKLLQYSATVISNEGGQSSNGQAAMAAISLALAGEIEDARYFIGMCLGSSDEIEKGHTGPYFGQLWTGLGVGLSGDKGASEYFSRTRWIRNQQRRWDGGFRYDSWKGLGYSGLSETAHHLIAFAQARKKLVITGRGLPAGLAFTDAEVNRTLVSFDPLQTMGFDWVWEHKSNYDPDVRQYAVTQGGNYLNNANFYNWIKSGIVGGSLMDRLGAYDAVKKLEGRFSSSQKQEIHSLLFSVVQNEDESVRYRTWAIEVLLRRAYNSDLSSEEFLAILDVYHDDEVYVNRYEDRYIGPAIADYLEQKRTISRIVDGPFGGDLSRFRATVKRMLTHRHSYTRSAGVSLLNLGDNSQQVLIYSNELKEILLDERRDYIGYAGAHWLADATPAKLMDLIAEWEIPSERITGDNPTARVNLSRIPRAEVSQSGTAFGGDAGRAVDGDTNGNYSAGSVTHSANVPNSWWQVDLGGIAEIDSIIVYNRAEGLEKRLSNYRITILDQDGVVVSNKDFFVANGHAGASHTWSFNPVYGQVVRIEMLGLNRDNNYVLSLAEVEVMGKVPDFDLISNVNWARAPGVSAQQSTTAMGRVAGRAIDGNTDGISFDNGVSETQNIPGSWWEVDLGEEKFISTVKLHNLQDSSFSGRLSNVRITVYGANGNIAYSVDHNGNVGRLQSFETGGVFGMKVRVERIAPAPVVSWHVLAIVEVEVIGQVIEKNVSLEGRLRDDMNIVLDYQADGRLQLKPSDSSGATLNYEWSTDLKQWHSVGATVNGVSSSYIGVADPVTGARVIDVVPRPKKLFLRAVDD